MRQTKIDKNTVHGNNGPAAFKLLMPEGNGMESTESGLKTVVNIPVVIDPQIISFLASYEYRINKSNPNVINNPAIVRKQIPILNKNFSKKRQLKPIVNI